MIVAILVLGWYKVQKMKVEHTVYPPPEVGYNLPQQDYPPKERPVIDSDESPRRHAVEQFGAPLSQTPSEDNIASARLRYDPME